MQREDKIAFIVLGLVFMAVVGGGLYGVWWLGHSLFGWFAAAGATSGVGWVTAFIVAVPVSFVFMVIFALVSGGGDLLGELPFMLIGFFVMVAFFTLSLALIF